ncbi:MAG: FAD-binding protein, partial [Alistipes sp.]|nr:FAD-binding protein [Candidatus Minthomonas equi]
MNQIPNTFGIRVSADTLVEYDSVEELRSLILDGSIRPPFLNVGQGSNFVFTSDFHGTVLHSAIDDFEMVDEDEKSVTVRVGAGVIWDEFVEECVSRGWYGVENLSLIPGQVGAAAVQNIGAYGVEVKDVITAVSA